MHPASFSFRCIYDHTPGQSKDAIRLYPGTGSRDRLEHNVVNAPLLPLWTRVDRGKSLKASLRALLLVRASRMQRFRRRTSALSSVQAGTRSGVPLATALCRRSAPLIRANPAELRL